MKKQTSKQPSKRESKHQGSLLEFPQWARPIDERTGGSGALQKDGEAVKYRVFNSPEMASIFSMLSLINLQLGAIDETFHLMLEKMAENENVRDVAKFWDEKKAQVSAFIEEVYDMVVEEAEE